MDGKLSKKFVFVLVSTVAITMLLCGLVRLATPYAPLTGPEVLLASGLSLVISIGIVEFYARRKSSRRDKGPQPQVSAENKLPNAQADTKKTFSQGNPTSRRQSWWPWVGVCLSVVLIVLSLYYLNSSSKMALRKPVKPIQTGHSLLLPADKEEPGYALYSYLLLVSKPADAVRENYLGVIKAIFTMIEEIERMKSVNEKASLNNLLIPIALPMPARFSPEWVLENYDYPRAQMLFAKLIPEPHDGVFLITVEDRLSVSTNIPRAILCQELTHVRPSVSQEWIHGFLKATAKQSDIDKVHLFVLNARNAFAISAADLPKITFAVGEWLSLGKQNKESKESK